MSEHALFSPSGAHRWISCPGSLALEKDIPNVSSVYADEGTTAHTLAANILLCEPLPSNISREMLKHVEVYTDLVDELSLGHQLFVERRVDFSSYIDQPPEEAFGTSDAIILRNDGEIIIIDLKYGMGVRVDAEENEQLMLYALGALAEFSLTHEIKNVRLVVSQPRLNHVSEWCTTVEKLEAFARRAEDAAAWVKAILNDVAGGLPVSKIEPDHFFPSEDACRFCRAKATCPALFNQVCEATDDMFEPVDKAQTITLNEKMNKVGMLEQWAKAIRAEMEKELFAGAEFKDWKLVEGKRGHRKWIDAEAAEAAMKAMRLKKDEMYDYSIISPTEAEKRFEKNNPRKWSKLKGLYAQAQGRPSVAPRADKRPAYSPTSTADSFDNYEGNDLI